eukprot:7850368-Alexandrium_andersonii.AAC.1
MCIRDRPSGVSLELSPPATSLLRLGRGRCSGAAPWWLPTAATRACCSRPRRRTAPAFEGAFLPPGPRPALVARL